MIGTVKELIPKMLELDQDKIYELKEQKKKRTLDQNSYYWQLLNKLATKIKIPSTELHFEMIKKSCPFEEYLVPYEASLRGIEYYIEKGKIERNGKYFKTIRVYVGSSLLDTTEMGILLDNLIEECKLQGIQTMTPDELAKMRSLENESVRSNWEMKKTPLKRKTPLKAYTSLKAKTPLKSETPLKTYSKKRAKAERERYSIFTSDLKHCIEDKDHKGHIDLHECFNGKNRLKSMKYGLVVPLCRNCHNNDEIVVKWQVKGRQSFIKEYGKEMFIKEFQTRKGVIIDDK